MTISGAHVLMTTDAVGGAFTYSALLARGLCEAGARVTLVLQGPPAREDQFRQLDGVSGLQPVLTDLALEWMDPDAGDASRARRELQRLERQHAPDIVHINGYRDAQADWRAPVVCAAHSCVQTWWRACRGEAPGSQWGTYAENVAAGLAKADAWLAPTMAFRDEIEALYAPPVSGVVIHNGIGRVARSAAKQRFILAAGRLWDEAKNIAALAAVASRVAWPLRIAGPLALDAANEEQHPQTATWLGPLAHSALLGEMQAASIFVSPARYEPFGLSVLEAASSGCALVLSDIPTFRELWDDAAFFVPRNDPQALADALNELCRNAALRETLQAAALRRAGRYTAEQMLARTVDLYETVLNKRTVGIRSARHTRTVPA
jgi:glycosyltransferase involved in cell wall biosynthesis